LKVPLRRQDYASGETLDANVSVESNETAPVQQFKKSHHTVGASYHTGARFFGQDHMTFANIPRPRGGCKDLSDSRGKVPIGLRAPPAEPFYTSQLIAPLNDLHNHGSSVLELPNGDVLVSWYKGSGERRSDDVKIVGARMRQGMDQWSEVFDMADFAEFPDCNAALTIDQEGRVWLFWPLILPHEWETAILMSRPTRCRRAPMAPTTRVET
jgi:hypothetical protein